MPGPTFMRGDRVTLHPIEPEDAEEVAAMVDHPEIWPHLAVAAPTSAEEQRDWIEELADSETIAFLVTADGETVGMVTLKDPSPVWGIAELAYLIVPEAQGNGYATDATRRCCRYAFDDRRLHKIFANVFEGNRASITVLERIGFTHEGTFREHAYVRGVYCDVERYDLLADEFDR
ncbi:MAG: GNAT family N-acetyltransferase [Halococcoides sp.]